MNSTKISDPWILGIDTSCYTTSAAIVCNGELIAFERKLLPVPAGECGLRQSEAVFAHIRQLPSVLELLPDFRNNLCAVSVSQSPTDAEASYMPVFTVGTSFARALSKATQTELIPTTHQRGHIWSGLYHSGLTADDFIAVHLSGGTTDVLEVHSQQLKAIGRSLDLHAGQLIDRIGVRMGLNFPCGPELERIALSFSGKAIQILPVSMDDGNCHLSGAEAALLRMMDHGVPKEDIAFSLFDFLTRTVFRMIESAYQKTQLNQVLLVGGVASSDLLRQLLSRRISSRCRQIRVYFGEKRLSSDNAAGVALLGEKMWKGQI